MNPTRRSRRRTPTGAKSPSPSPPPSAATSARSLASALWKMHLASDLPFPSPFQFQLNSDQTQKPTVNEPSGCKEDGIFFKLETCAKLPNTDMERITKWDHSYPTKSEPTKFYKSPKALVLSPSLGIRRDKKEIYNKIESMKETLILERKDRLKMEKTNSKLLTELKEARSSAKKYFKGYEKERKAREGIEEVCEDLAREIEHEKADIETVKNESLKMRETVEEERRMLQMAEVWREERVQMKLVDAKIALENKYSQLNRLQVEIEAFLKSHNADVAAVRRAEFLIKAAKESSQNWVRGDSSNLQLPLNGNLNEPVSCDSSQGSVRSVSGALKENNWEENNNGSNNVIGNGKLRDDLSEVCSSATRNSRNKGASTLNKFWGNNGNSRKSGANVQKKKRRNGLNGKIVGTRKEVCDVGIIDGENNFVF